ncbi:MAG: nitroreductase family protein [Holophaga sp.]|nr:nitroreductase family protein [Holophaga sp.]
MNLSFEVAEERCAGCGLCVTDCLPHVLEMYHGHPRVGAGREDACYQCQHCFTICPEGAVSILGLRPEDSEALPASFDAANLELLIKARRSVRQYQEKNLDPDLLQHLLEVAWHSPTGANSRQVRFTVVDDRAKLARFRSEVLAALARLVRAGGLPAGQERFADFVRLWVEDGVDVLFRGAPHLIIASVPKAVATPLPDCMIALSSFDLVAQAHGVATLWDGLATIAIRDLVPETCKTLGIPDDHLLGYAMLFGKAAVTYARTAQHPNPLVHRMA